MFSSIFIGVAHIMTRLGDICSTSYTPYLSREPLRIQTGRPPKKRGAPEKKRTLFSETPPQEAFASEAI